MKIAHSNQYWGNFHSQRNPKSRSFRSRSREGVCHNTLCLSTLVLKDRRKGWLLEFHVFFRPVFCIVSRNVQYKDIKRVKIENQQECIPVGCVLPACYHTGGLDPPDRDPPDRDPLDRDPQTETPMDRDPPWTDTPMDRDPLDRDPNTETPPGQRPPDRDPQIETPSSWTETPGQQPPWTETPLVMWPVVHSGTETHPVNRMAQRCKNITLPQLHCGW